MGIVDYAIIENPCTAHILFQYFIGSLLPEMNAFPAPRSVLILDNAAIHHYEPFQCIAEFVGVRLVYLPPYSPHLNMIELFFNAVKRCLEKNKVLVDNTPLFALVAICERYRDYDTLGAMENAGYLRYCRTN